MKRLLFIATITVSVLQVKAQLFPEKIKLYKVKFNAREITGQKRFSGTSAGFRSKILNPLVQKKYSNFIHLLGTYRQSIKKVDPFDLFNLSLQNRSFPLLDSIDFDFYESRGFDKLLEENPNIKDNEKYKSLRDKLRKCKIAEEKKAVLFNDEYYDLRVKLTKTRYEIIPSTFDVNQKKVSKLTAELKANIDTLLIKNNVQGSAKMKGYLRSLADEATLIKGTYYIVNMDPSYTSSLKIILEGLDISKYKNDKFIQSLKNFKKSSTTVINSSLVAVKINGDYDKTKVNESDVSSELQANYQLTESDANKLAASLNVSFEKTVETSINVKFNSVFVIRYFSTNKLNSIK